MGGFPMSFRVVCVLVWLYCRWCLLVGILGTFFFFFFLTFLPELDDTLFGFLSILFFFGVVSGGMCGVVCGCIVLVVRFTFSYSCLYLYLLSRSFPGSTLGLKYYLLLYGVRRKVDGCVNLSYRIVCVCLV